MKKSIIIIFLLASTYSFSQWNAEFDYFTLKVGAVNSIFTPQPDSLPNKMVIASNNIDHLQAFPDSGFNFNYSPGYYATFLYNHDLKNDKIGVAFGLEYKMYGISSNFYTDPAFDYTLREVNRVSQITVPVYVKFGNKFYEPQKYIYTGVTYSYNIFATKTEKISYTEQSRISKLDKAVLKKTNFGLTLGYNFMFFNFEANYILGNFLSKDYSVELPDQSIMNPYAVQPKGIFFIKTGLAFPLNSWTPRKLYSIEMWFRRIFK